MRTIFSIIPLLTSTVAAVAIPSAGKATVTAAASGNPFSGYQLYVNPYNASEVSASALPTMTGTASKAAEVPSFYWLDTAYKVSTMGDYLCDIQAQNAAGADPLVKYSDVHTILVVEPDSLANLVTNLAVSKCANAHDAYLECTNYAVTQLNLENVAMYLDAGRLLPFLVFLFNGNEAAQLYADVYKNASQPASLRGLATNVANYNGWSLSSCPSYTSGNSNCDEKRFVNAFAPLLRNAGWDAHFITDTGRNGVQSTQQNAWGDWCNVKGTGVSVRPTTDTGDDLQKAFVWAKPGGESDGTSDTSATRYDAHCGYSYVIQPAPEAGNWVQAYFEQLVVNANPSF
ncbi:hypothetical protein NUU61_007751 [Penicillium alfredii]|uniref:Glucanase n=1 Tax=Penicillium alfredii TaxID=1506179 RepID=A0A9W9JYB2_9EURO|nr:uncharacterized protein NUU61_007751 [Penicillium alfredii]KAJ5086444.1 hypothetical protein NUU61_007751 [Penicillium alfredii]